MPALSHELHITVAILALIKVNKRYAVPLEVKAEDSRILLTPAHTAGIAKDEEMRIFHSFPYIFDSTAKISCSVIFAVVFKHISSACVYRHGVRALDFFQNSQVVFICNFRKFECLAYLIVNSLNSVVSILERQPLTYKSILRSVIEKIFLV